MLECKSNLIYLGQLQDTGFIYYDKPTKMILMRREKVVAYVRHNKNLFVLDLIKPKKAMVISCERPIYIISKNR